MSAIAKTGPSVADASDQSLQRIKQLKNLGPLVGAIVAYVADTVPLKDSYSLEDLSFGWLAIVRPTKIVNFESGELGRGPPAYRLYNILRGKQQNLLLVHGEENEVTDEKTLKPADLTQFTVIGAKPSFSESAPYRTYEIAVRMGIASPRALEHLKYQLDIRGNPYNTDNTYVARIPFPEAVRRTLAKQGLVDAPKPAEPSPSTDGKQE